MSQSITLDKHEIVIDRDVLEVFIKALGLSKSRIEELTLMSYKTTEASYVTLGAIEEALRLAQENA